MKYHFYLLALLTSLSTTAIFASNTTIIQSDAVYKTNHYDVQCNHWGWVSDKVVTWENACTSLEIFRNAGAGSGWYFANTQDQCPDSETTVFSIYLDRTQPQLKVQCIRAKQ